MSVHEIAILVWAVLAAATLAVELIGHFVARRFPTAGELFSMLARSRVLRWTLLLGWAWLGWHLFVRGSGA